MAEAVLLIGTRKGLFIARSQDDRSAWSVEEIRFPMQSVYAIGVDNRSDTRGATPRIFANATSEHFGATLVHSDDLGATWVEPEQPPIRFPEDAGAALERVWQVVPGPDDSPGVVYAGVEPSALFRSEDDGLTFALVEGLWNHPHREQWYAGQGGQAVHSVLPHPTDAKTVTVAMSTGGVYRTSDGGATWAPTNRGISAYFLPHPQPEFGQCVHKIAMHPAKPDRMFAQNHRGVYRTDDAGSQWVSIASGLPADFGFPIVVHPHRPETVYVFPLVSDFERLPPHKRCRVYRTDDAGATWTALSEGLPTAPFHASVLRDAMCTDLADPAGIYFGTRDGSVFASRNDGDTWMRVAEHLPDVLAVRAITL